MARNLTTNFHRFLALEGLDAEARDLVVAGCLSRLLRKEGVAAERKSLWKKLVRNHQFPHKPAVN